jgi:CheY-like chemotaxis protein
MSCINNRYRETEPREVAIDTGRSGQKPRLVAEAISAFHLMEIEMELLVVDDDELIRALLIEILSAYGYNKVTQADSGIDALRKIEAAKKAEKSFDCFMFDIQMPEMDGIELCHAVRNFENYKDTPIVMITAMNGQDYVERAFAAGATDYVTKPFDTTELLSRIRLADRLQSETKRAAAAVSAEQVQSKKPFDEPLNLAEIRGFVNSAILENYVLITMEQQHFPLAAIAIHVPELNTVHAGSSNDEFFYVVADVAEVISDAMVGSQAFMSYLGNGVFLCVGPRFKLVNEADLQTELITMLNDEELVYCEEVETRFTAQVGPKAVPKLLEKRGDLKFLDRAIENLSANSKSIVSRTKKIGSKVRTAFAA